MGAMEGVGMEVVVRGGMEERGGGGAEVWRMCEWRKGRESEWRKGRKNEWRKGRRCDWRNGRRCEWRVRRKGESMHVKSSSVCLVSDRVSDLTVIFDILLFENYVCTSY